MLYTTLNEIRNFSPCGYDWKQLLTYLNKTKADDESLDFKTILEAVGIKDTLWYLRTQEFKDYYKLVVRVAYSVLPIFENKYPEDKRPRLAIEAVEKFINGKISKEELDKYGGSAWASAKNVNWVSKAAAVASANVPFAVYDTENISDWAVDATESIFNSAVDAYANNAWAIFNNNDYNATDAWDVINAAALKKESHVMGGVMARARKEKWKEIEKIFIEECLN
jgi:hypothetical protein